MAKPSLSVLAALTALVIVGCVDQTNSLSKIVVPEAHSPIDSLDSTALQDYAIAYCWRSPELDAFGKGRTDLVGSRGDGSQASTITEPIIPPESPVSLGCYGPGPSFRQNLGGLAWRPQQSQLTAVTSYSGPPGDHFDFIQVAD